MYLLYRHNPLDNNKKILTNIFDRENYESPRSIFLWVLVDNFYLPAFLKENIWIKSMETYLFNIVSIIQFHQCAAIGKLHTLGKRLRIFRNNPSNDFERAIFFIRVRQNRRCKQKNTTIKRTVPAKKLFFISNKIFLIYFTLKLRTKRKFWF